MMLPARLLARALLLLAAAQNVVAGYEDDLYHPEYEVTRDQMPVYIARAFELSL